MYILGYIYYLRETLAGGLPTQPVAAGPGLLDALGRLVRTFLAAFGRWQAQVRMERDLADLPDWALRDIGIVRGDIAGLAETLAQPAERDARSAPQAHTAHSAHSAPAARLSVVGCG